MSAGRTTCPRASSMTAPCICPEKPTQAISSGRRPAFCRALGTAMQQALHQSSGCCSAHPIWGEANAACSSVASAIAAERGGAGRVEVCSGLIEGGVTPGTGLVEAVRNRSSIAVHVMIRPRGGDFYYDADEFEIMRRDIDAAQRMGVDGVVFGILPRYGSVELARTRALVELAR